MAEISEFEKKQEMTRVSDAMAVYTKPALAAIYGVISKNEGELIGSGTFLRIRGKTYLLTAKHVIDLAENYAFLAHTTSFGGHPAPFTNPFRWLPKPLDLAITRIDGSALENTAVVPFNVETIATDSSNLERQFLFCHGYPCHKSKPIRIEGGGVHSESMPFHTSDATSNWDQFDPAIHTVVGYPNVGWFDATGPIPRPNAYCIERFGALADSSLSYSGRHLDPGQSPDRWCTHTLGQGHRIPRRHTRRDGSGFPTRRCSTRSRLFPVARSRRAAGGRLD